MVVGRLIKIEDTQAWISRAGQTQVVSIRDLADARLGDLIEVRAGKAKILTPYRGPRDRSGAPQLKWFQHLHDPRRLQGIKIRKETEQGIRDFFTSQGFTETRTPLLVPCPGMEPHIRPFKLESGSYLPTSPEFAMKRLLVGGLEKIFQICPSFRLEPKSITHHPEFTMLEWYRAYAGYEEIMRDTELLIESLAMRVHGKPSIPYQGRSISVRTPWPRLKIRDLFHEMAGIDLVRCNSRDLLAREAERLYLKPRTEDTWDDIYFLIWLNHIEPKLPENQAVFVMRYPPSQAALSVVDQDSDGSRWARRFELYAGGLELGNAFEELTDPAEQRRRFVEDMELRERIYGPSFAKNPLDEEFLRALEEGMPPSGGIAVGVDRLVMLLANETDISKTIWLESDPGHTPY